jgi:hypothetical protein
VYWNYKTLENEMRPAETETRVKVQPNGCGSRSFYRTDYKMVENAEGGYDKVDTGIKPVTLNIIENVTAVPK